MYEFIDRMEELGYEITIEKVGNWYDKKRSLF